MRAVEHRSMDCPTQYRAKMRPLSTRSRRVRKRMPSPMATKPNVENHSLSENDHAITATRCSVGTPNDIKTLTARNPSTNLGNRSHRIQQAFGRADIGAGSLGMGSMPVAASGM